MGAPFASILHKEAIQKIADSRSLTRGRDYFERGRVTSLTRKRSSLVGVVLGWGDAPYAVRVWVNESSLAYSCTCPHGEEGNFCKHCVALSFAWLDRAAREGDPEDTD